MDQGARARREGERPTQLAGCEDMTERKEVRLCGMQRDFIQYGSMTLPVTAFFIKRMTFLQVRAMNVINYGRIKVFLTNTKFIYVIGKPLTAVISSGLANSETLTGGKDHEKAD